MFKVKPLFNYLLYIYGLLRMPANGIVFI